MAGDVGDRVSFEYGGLIRNGEVKEVVEGNCEGGSATWLRVWADKLLAWEKEGVDCEFLIPDEECWITKKGGGK
jgi:hypothetical protein